MIRDSGKFIFKIFILIIFMTSTSQGQEVLTLGEGGTPGEGTLADIAWLAGYWKGAGLGGTCDEVWIPESDNAMHGIFRIEKDGSMQFTEYMAMMQSGNSLTLKLKHFSGDLTPWEEKDKWVEFKLVKLEDSTAYFNGLTYKRTGNELYVWLRLKSQEKVWIEEFRFVKEGL